MIFPVRAKAKALLRKYWFWRFANFEKKINPQSIELHRSLQIWVKKASHKSAQMEAGKPNPVTAKGNRLREAVLNEFRNRYEGKSKLRILIHIPDPAASPAGSFLFENLRASLAFLGIPVARLDWNDTALQILDEFQPNVILTSDHHTFLERIDWRRLQAYRQQQPVRLGLTASLAAYGNSPLKERLKAAQARDVNFFYSFRSPEYIASRKDYSPFFDFGYQIVSVEFGANILDYYPAYGLRRDIPFVFFGSINPDKTSRYLEYFKQIFLTTKGYIEGVGWKHFHNATSPQSQRLIYARAIVGINLHLSEQIRWANELNERTYILAACGVPQVIDNPALLSKRFSEDSFFIGRTPKEYQRSFQNALHNTEERTHKALLALKEVYARHTTLHRAAKLVEDLNNLSGMP